MVHARLNFLQREHGWVGSEPTSQRTCKWKRFSLDAAVELKSTRLTFCCLHSVQATFLADFSEFLHDNKHCIYRQTNSTEHGSPLKS